MLLKVNGWKESKLGVFLALYFAVFWLNMVRFTSQISVFGPNTEKYRPQKTPNLDTFYTEGIFHVKPPKTQN